MLVPSDLRYNLKGLRFCSFLGTIPFDFDDKLELGKLRKKTSLWGKFLFKLWQLCNLFHVLHVSFRAIVFFSDENGKPHHLPVLILVWGNIIGIAFGALISFDFNSDLTMKNFSEVFAVLQDNYSEVEESKESKVLKSKSKSKGRKLDMKIKVKRKIQDQIEVVKGKNIYELITIYTPVIIYPIILVVPAAYFLDPDMPVFFVSNFAPENRTWWIFGMCLCLEFIVYGFCWAVGHFHLCVIQSFIHSTRRSLKRQLQKLSDVRQPLILRLLAVEKSIKATELRVNLFNLGNSTIMYIVKLECLEFAVGGGFGALLLFQTEPIFTALYGTIFVCSIMFFTVVFSRTFDIATVGEKLKSNMKILVHSQNQRLELEWKREEYKRMIMSIRPLGIKVGGFGKVEREAVPIFTDFVIQQIIDLLLV